ncbi:reticulon-like protein B5 isoform X2 [Andrographis paniculata]|uniref:reticulon-like protein B5 isoform X2 n=1 Tax=Andrographis paniculata TaxID=175694 RepID=UPI0021E9631E|nr:reticulon-like protein B5 isoform X2 [Andrographis paniculata]
MADHHKERERDVEQKEEEEKKGEPLLQKIADKIHADDSPSSSDSDCERKYSIKAKVYSLFGREKPLHGVLGGGKPADVLLWRDKKLSGGVLVVATAIWFLLDILECHMFTVICHGLILGLAIVFLWSHANSFIKKSGPRIPNVHIPEDPVLKVASAVRIQINHAFSVLRDIVSGRDAKKLFSLIAGLWVISIVGSWCDFVTLIYPTGFSIASSL